MRDLSRLFRPRSIAVLGGGADALLIAALAQASVAVTPESQVTMVVERDGEEVELTGTMGNPTVPRTVIRAMSERTPEQIAIWKAWLNQP